MKYPNFMISKSWRQHLMALILALLLSSALNWEIFPFITSHILGIGYDPPHNLWRIWHTLQAIQGKEPLFSTSRLYYPDGTSLLTHGLGHVMGVLALPFWFWGAAAAYNGALLVGIALTGYCMYVLARGLGFDHGIALIAGLFLMTAPMCLAGVFGHMTKVFLGGLPLALLSIHRACDLQRHHAWTVAPALAMLLLLLHHGYQFVFASLALLFFLVAFWLAATPDQRPQLVRRVLFCALWGVLIVGPLLLATMIASRDPALVGSANNESLIFQLDAIEFLLPSSFARFIDTIPVYERYGIRNSIETFVSLSWVAILLCIPSLLSRDPAARRWLLLTLLCVVLAMGPSFHAFGITHFTDYQLPIVLPYAFVTELPGLGFLRTPGRFMLLGFVALGIAICYGLAWLVQRFPSYRYLILTLTVALLLLERWPTPFPHEPLPPTPAFYAQIAPHPESYGVFDLPIQGTATSSYIGTSSRYQFYQMIHGKGIAAGYLSRTYAHHPRFAYFMHPMVHADDKTFSVNGRPVNIYAHVQHDLAEAGYRYLIWHKASAAIDEPQRFGDESAQDFLHAVVGEQQPLIDDATTAVYAVSPQPPAPTDDPTLRLRHNWIAQKGDGRWAVSPATLDITAPRLEPALLVITPTLMYDPEVSDGLGRSGMMDVSVGAYPATRISLESGVGARTPLMLHEGTQSLTMTLAAGNFRPVPIAGSVHQPIISSWDSYPLMSFAVAHVNLLTLDHVTRPPDIFVNGRYQTQMDNALVVLHGDGWYFFEPTTGGRWLQSPATLLIYSDAPQIAQLTLSPIYAYSTTMRLVLNGEPTPWREIPTGYPFPFEQLALQAGWNIVTFEAGEENIRPFEVDSATPDERPLSVFVRDIQVMITE